MKHTSPLSKYGRITQNCLMLVLTGLIMGGCASSPKSRVYIFTPEDNWQSLTGRELKDCDYVIGFADLGFPEYLDQPQIVTRVNDTEISINEFSRWGIPLNKAIFEMLGADLARRLPKAYLELSPRRRPGKTDYIIHLNVIRFDGIPGKTMELVAEWKISTPADASDEPVRRTTITRSEIADTSYESYLSAMKQAINEMSGAIADAIEERRK